VLILTAQDGIQNRVKGLDLGPTITWPNPLRLAELEARVRALTRRGHAGAPTTLKHGKLAYDTIGKVAQLDGQPLELSARELALLEMLMQRAGRMVSKEQLVDHLCEWGEEVSTNAIEVYVTDCAGS